MKNITLILMLLFSSIGYSQTTDYSEQNKAINNYIQQLVKEDHFKPSYLQSLFKGFVPSQEVIQDMNAPFENQPWFLYKKHFIMKERIHDGVIFWKKEKKFLDKAKKEFDVSPEIIVAIIGVESNYGKIKGHFHVFNALTTLAFFYPTRNDFFQKELTGFLKICANNHIDPNSVMGSYAGAIGQPQFMPTSFQQFAIDFDGDNEINLVSDPADVIGSIANFLHYFGWIKNQPAAIRLPAFSNTDKNKTQLLSDSKREPALILSPVFLVQLNGEKELINFLGMNNLLVIMHYNKSILYAMTINELGKAIKKAYIKTLSPPEKTHK